jgi:lipopolysaccharide/colanic/teichoic acid biosynthesis glycosyltransferase
MPFEGPPSLRRRFATVARSILDVTISAALLILALPLILVIVLALELESPGPVFYRARRVGHMRRPLDVLKFRKMRCTAEGLPLTLDRDERLTKVGRILARTKLDELPQLINVLRGEMSLVGPRPEDARFAALYQHAYDEIVLVLPGITGPAQLAFARESSILDPDDPVGHYVDSILPQKVRMEVEYARRHDFFHDLLILVWTAAAVLLRTPVAVDRRTGALRRRRRRRREQARVGDRALVFTGRADVVPGGVAVEQGHVLAGVQQAQNQVGELAGPGR